MLCLAAPTDALATSADTAPTRAYVLAARTLVDDLVRNVGAGQAAAGALVARVRAECPDVLTGAPADENATTISKELTDGTLLEFTLVDLAAARRFLRRTRTLHWADGLIERRVLRRRAALDAELTLTPPNMCADLRSWAAGGFRTAPPGAAAFVRSYERAQSKEATNDGLLELINAMSAREGPSLKRVVSSVDGQARRFANLLLTSFLDAEAELLTTLGAPREPLVAASRLPD